MRLFIVFFLAFFLFISCTENTDDRASEQSKVDTQNTEDFNTLDYFFPNDSLIPYIYVYQESENPIDEKLYRIYRLQDEKDTSLIVERFNANFRITEGFTHDLTDSLKISEYMIVDKDGIKRTAEVLSNKVFPVNLDDIAYFVSHFPSHVDSLSMIYESKRTVAESDLKMEVMGEEVEAIRVVDSLKVHLVDPKTKESNTKKIVTDRFYAKGFGLVEWGSDELNVHYRLKKILTEKWWVEYAQAPQVRM